MYCGASLLEPAAFVEVVCHSDSMVCHSDSSTLAGNSTGDGPDAVCSWQP